MTSWLLHWFACPDERIEEVLQQAPWTVSLTGIKAEQTGINKRKCSRLNHFSCRGLIKVFMTHVTVFYHLKFIDFLKSLLLCSRWAITSVYLHQRHSNKDIQTGFYIELHFSVMGKKEENQTRSIAVTFLLFYFITYSVFTSLQFSNIVWD